MTNYLRWLPRFPTFFLSGLCGGQYGIICGSVACMSTAPFVPEAVQGLLFDTGIDFAFLRSAEEDLMAARLAPNTLRAYAQAFDLWSGWCVSAGREPLPASCDSLCMFITWALSERHLRLATVRLSLAAIRRRSVEAGFASPVDDRVRLLLGSAARRLRERPGGRAALSIDQLAKICSAEISRPIEIRNRALILVGFAGGMRRSELVSLDMADVRFCAQGFTYRLGASKTDQEGKGRLVGIPPGSVAATCPVLALRAWLDVRGRASGPLFTRITAGGSVTLDGLRGSVVSRVLKSALEASGVNSAPYAAHSLRAGCVTAAAECGAGELAIMRRTGHSTIGVMLKYIRPARAFACDPLAGVL
jgi:integrase